MLPMKQVLSKLQKYLHRVRRSRSSYWRALPTPCRPRHDTDISAAIYKESTGIIADGCVIRA